MFPGTEHKYVNDPNKFVLKKYTCQISRRMDVSELKSYLMEHILDKINDNLLPARFTVDKLKLFVVKQEASIETILKELRE